MQDNIRKLSAHESCATLQYVRKEFKDRISTHAVKTVLESKLALESISYLRPCSGHGSAKSDQSLETKFSESTQEWSLDAFAALQPISNECFVDFKSLSLMS